MSEIIEIEGHKMNNQVRTHSEFLFHCDRRNSLTLPLDLRYYSEQEMFNFSEYCISAV